MNQRERIAKAMYEAPDVGDDRQHVWPPSHSTDRAWWLSRAEAAQAVFEEANTPSGDERAIIHQVREFATKERDSIRGRYGAGSAAYAGYANACDDILGMLDGSVQGEPSDVDDADAEDLTRAFDALKSEYWALKREGHFEDGAARGMDVKKLRDAAIALRAAAATEGEAR